MTVKVWIGNSQAVLDRLANLLSRVVGLEAAGTGGLPATGGTMTGLLNMSGHRIESVGAADSDDDATNRADVKALINAAVNALVNGAPGLLDSLKELADAIGDDPNFATTVANALAAKVAKAGDTMTGDLAFGGHRATGLGAAQNAGDAVNLAALNAATTALNTAIATLTTNLQAVIQQERLDRAAADTAEQQGRNTDVANLSIVIGQVNARLAQEVSDRGAAILALTPRLAPVSSELAQFGDSRTDEGGTGTSVNESLGYQSYAEIFGGGAFTMPPDLNFGVAGDTTTMMLARVAAVAASRADIVVMLGGTNDVPQGISAATTIANYSAIYAALVTNAGKRLVVINELPRNDSNAPTGAGLFSRLAVRDWVQRTMARWPGVTVVDAAAFITDPAAANWAPLAGLLRDGLHFAPRAALLIGRALATAIARHLPPRQRLAIVAADQYDATRLVDGNLVSNAMMTGTANPSSFNAGTGTVPTGWLPVVENGSGLTVAWSVVQVEGYNWTQVQVSGTPTQDNPRVRLVQSLTAANIAAGDALDAAIGVQLDAGSTNLQAVSATMAMDAAASASANASTGGYLLGPEALAGVFMLPKITASAAPSAASIGMSINGLKGSPMVCTARFGRPTARKLAA